MDPLPSGGGGPDGAGPVLTRILLARARAGDQAAELELFAGLRSELILAARRHRLMGWVRRSATEEDVVSEVWLRCFAARVLDGFLDTGRGSLRRLMFRLLNRTMVDIVRRANAQRRGSGSPAVSLDGALGPVAQNLPCHDPTPTSEVRTTELLQRCGSVLTERERRVWMLIEWEELNSKQVGQRLDMAPAAVRGVLRRARARLLSRLGHLEESRERA